MTESNSLVTGTILHLQRLSTEDGPGIRTTVFFKGCPLKCAWCHNPESLLLKPQVQWIKNRCIGCDSCIEECEAHGLHKTEEGLVRDRAICTACGRCVEACPSGAMEMLGQQITVGDLVKELVKDRSYFEKSGGGVTLSGGDPTLQPRFTEELIHELKQQGIHVALDTSGFCAPETLQKLIREVDILLFDVKLIDNAEHQKWTGVENARILSNLRIAHTWAVQQGKNRKLWVRTPLIPGATDSQQNIQAIGDFLAQHMDGSMDRWELCAFNNLCRDKYDRLDMDWKFKDTLLMTKEDLEQVGTWAKTSSVHPERVFVTGAARLEN